MLCLERGFSASVCSEQLAKSKQIFLSFFFSSLPLCASFILNQKLALLAISVGFKHQKNKIVLRFQWRKKYLKLVSMKQPEQKSVR